ncbi:MAG: thioesterase family protein [Acidimicrobiales bacterium]
MANTYFLLLDEHDGGGTYRSGEQTAGPWDAGLQHGGPPNALLVAVAERVAATTLDRSDLQALRLAAEFVGPVPVAEVSVAAHVARAARSAVLVECALSAAGRLCLQARIWLTRAGDTAAIARAPAPQPVPSSGTSGISMAFPYGDSIEWRFVSGSLTEPGPALVWARPRLELLPGQQYTGLQRAVLIGDSASGVGSELDWARWTFPNVDLDVHLARPMRGEWLCMDARTDLGPTGAALAHATLSDADGPFGRTAQTLLLASRH